MIMKKTIIIMVMALFMAKGLAAQERDEYRSKFHAGIKAGANLSNVYDINGDEFSADFKPGLAAGIFFAIPIGTYVGIQPEILYSQKGYKSDGSILGSSYKITHSADFIDIPLMLQIKPAEALTIMAGPIFSYMVHHNNEFENSFLTVQQEQDFDNLNLRKNIFGITGGLDINIEHMVIGGRAGWDLMHNNGDGTSTSPRYRNLWFQATIGLRF
jgi:hypothetical protein